MVEQAQKVWAADVRSGEVKGTVNAVAVLQDAWKNGGRRVDVLGCLGRDRQR